VLRGLAALTAGAIAMSGGVAAAYAASLPTPVQRVAHRWLSPLGVPAPHHREVEVHRRGREHIALPSAPHVAAVPLLAVQQAQVVFGGPITLVATATTRGARVVLLSLEQGTWRTQATARAPSDLQVVFRVRPRTDATYAVAEPTTGRRSRPVPIVVQPWLSVTVHRLAQRWDVQVRVGGVPAGEQVQLVRATSRGLRAMTTARVDTNGIAVLVLTHPTLRAHYVVVVRSTRTHGAASAPLTPATRRVRAG
jgi:hypothetical protein